MDRIRKRAEDKFPMVLLTLLSIVQALALEFLWDHLRHRNELFEWSVIALVGWLQAAASLNVIILIWLMYAGMLMRFRWTPSIADSVLPFLVGLIQFFMIDIMGGERFALWIIVLALIYGMTDFINHLAMRRARRNPANSEFFDRFKPATLRDFLPQITTVTALLIGGFVLWTRQSASWFALLTLAAIHAGIAWQLIRASKYWRISMGEA